MRLTLLGLALVGCGAVRVGDEARFGDGEGPSGGADASGSAMAPFALVTVDWPRDCSGCADLLVQGIGGVGPYTAEWGDGERVLERRVCGDQLARALTVVITDAKGVRSPPHAQRLKVEDASCPADAGVPEENRLCLQNPSFEGPPGFTSGSPVAFDAEAAQRLLDQHAVRFPDGVLAPEREVLAIEALKALGQTAAAEQRLRAFHARYPNSRHAPRLSTPTK